MAGLDGNEAGEDSFREKWGGGGGMLDNKGALGGGVWAFLEVEEVAQLEVDEVREALVQIACHKDLYTRINTYSIQLI